MKASEAAGMLGLCRKAGKLISGFDATVKAAAEKKAAGVFFASDVSQKTLKELDFMCARCGLTPKMLDAQMSDLEHILGKKAGVFAVLDDGFSAKIATLCKQREV